MISLNDRGDAVLVDEPYKGLNSYQTEDAGLFFGRDADARQLIAKILSRRLTLLYAPSGAGKTSLLNALVIPGLEKQGWLAVRTPPTDSPVATLRAAVLQLLLPPPEAELRSIEAAAAALAPEVETGDLTLDAMLELYDQLAERDERRRRLVKPIPVAEPTKIFARGALATPFFQRVLRSSLSLELYAEHLALIGQLDAASRPGGLHIGPETRVATVQRFLQSAALRQSYAELADSFTAPDQSGLGTVLQKLTELRHRHGLNLQLALILDQFEELFTRFGDGEDVPSYRLRDDLFTEIKALHTAAAGAETGQTTDPEATTLPLRIVLSLRDEYLARTLDRVRDFAGATDEASFHLNFLRPADATAVIKQPAILYGYSYAKETYDALVKDLTREGRYIEPTPLQIVCERLWDVSGRALSKQGKAGEEEGLPKIEARTLEGMRGVEGILATFFTDFLYRELKEAWERYEALDMLQMLVTTNRTRNIVQYTQLVVQPLRDRHFREMVLRKLKEGKIVREEQRLGSRFVEITHEFLARPILDAVATESADVAGYGRFREAIRTLARYEEAELTDEFPALGPTEFVNLHHHREIIAWPDWAKELMFRSAIVHPTEPDVLAYWTRRYAESGSAADAATLLTEIRDPRWRRRLLGLEELAWIHEACNGAYPPELSDFQFEVILRSLLARGGDGDREMIGSIAREWANYGSRSSSAGAGVPDRGSPGAVAEKRGSSAGADR